MRNLRIEAVTADSYSFTPTLEAEAIVIRFGGTGDLVAVVPLGAFLGDLRDEVLRLKPKVLRLDVRELYFINSSCLKAFVNLVFYLAGAGSEAMVEFVTNSHLAWQERALSPIARMAPTTVRITKV